MTHEAEALYVVDSSVFPTNLGVNPQHTIMAMSRLAATRIADRARRGAAA
jgi:choline dehydrogenase-like flavoprotein